MLDVFELKQSVAAFAGERRTREVFKAGKSIQGWQKSLKDWPSASRVASAEIFVCSA